MVPRFVAQQSGYKLRVVGNIPQLGAWQNSGAIELQPSEQDKNMYSANLMLPLGVKIEAKVSAEGQVILVDGCQRQELSFDFASERILNDLITRSLLDSPPVENPLGRTKEAARMSSPSVYPTRHSLPPEAGFSSCSTRAA